MRSDWHDLAVSTDDDAAVAALDAAVRGFVGYEADMPRRMERLGQAAPDLALAHVFRGYMIMTAFRAAGLPQAREAALAAQRLEPGLSLRERAHVAALAALVAGELDRTLAIWEDILQAHPADLLAFRMHHFTAFWLGRPERMVAAVESVLPRYGRALPGHGVLLGCRAFAHEELGNYTLSEAAGRAAIDVDASDPWAAHAVAHVLEMQGRRSEGIDWLSSLEANWASKNNIRHHLWWHRALYHLEQRDFDAVLWLYDRRFRDLAAPLTSAQPDLYIDVQNAASMLFRLRRQGVDVGDRWQELADLAEARTGDCLSPFTLPHWMMALAATGRFERAEAMLAAMRDFVASGSGTIVPIVRDQALPACEAVLAHGRGEWRTACELLRPALGGMARLGGSHAQQDVLEQLYLDCALAADSLEDLRLIIERVRGRHPVAPEYRLGYAPAAARLAH